MEGESASANEPGRQGQGRSPGGDATVAYGGGDSPPPEAVDVPSLAPPRGDDELGWLGQYRLKRLIGSGGMGLVYLAEDTRLGRKVALKVMRPELAATFEASSRFGREARAAAAIKHDHVVTVYQVGEDKGVPFLAMEYLQGMSLQRWLERGRGPTIDQIMRIGREVAAGLAAAHRLGLVHRDIKPANIWLEAPAGRVKILDFGQARARREDVEITRAGAIVGTPAFMSPEQAVGEETGPASDLFSLGCVLYRLCCGRLPFEGNTILSVLNALATQTPASPIEVDPMIPEDLSVLVARLLAKSPPGRPASAQEVHDAIRAIERRLAAARRAGDPTVTDAAPQRETTPSPGPDTLAARPAGFVPGKRANPAHRCGAALAGAAALAISLGSVAWIGLGPRSWGLGWAVAPAGPVIGSRLPDRRPSAPATPTAHGLASPPIEAPPPSSPAASSPAPSVVSEARSVTGPSPDPPPAPPPVHRGREPALALAPPSVAARPDAPTPRTSEEYWGVLVDPDGDGRLVLDDGRQTATIEVPGSPHVLSAELRRLNAPRTLRPVRGDFRATVLALGTDRVAGRASMKEFPPYHGAGLLLWQDPGNYIRLEIASDIQRGKPRHYANFEYRQGARLVSSHGQSSDVGSAHLRLVRKGKEVIASFSTDGRRWVSFPALEVNLSADLKLGLLAINSASKPLVARFEDFHVQAIAGTDGASVP